jgi:hypothetical protein
VLDLQTSWSFPDLDLLPPAPPTLISIEVIL